MPESRETEFRRLAFGLKWAQNLRLNIFCGVT